MRSWRVVGALAAAGVALAACSSPSTNPSTAGPTPGAAAGQPVRVLYAGSLVNLMEHDIGPKFTAAEGYRFQGEGGGSDALANEIKGKVKQADVFISASPQTNSTLQGAAGGNAESWFATFASSPLVIGYSPKSRFAGDLTSKPWQQVLAEPGFRLGRTDPTTDPKGKLAVQALSQVGLTSLASDQSGVFPETELIGRLQSGQLDAGFFYSAEAAPDKIPTITIPPVSLGAAYTVTVLNQAPNRAGAVAFVNYLLGHDGSSTLTADGFQVTSPPAVSGDKGAVPAGLHPLIPAP
ncbi:extracellular solute-binding protein [Pseudonocardia xinjiangensis]|uniref:extracellular solute-binding protein n=1 Tax=Pseudonocardia xinjiangensis TaxID=75289 RepID=UPI003D8AB004